MMGLLKKERDLTVIWDKELPNRINAIVIDTSALSQETGHLILSYEFDGWEEYVTFLKKKAGTVF